jgi:hypothetical protein
LAGESDGEPRALLSPYKEEPGALQACDLGGIEAQASEFRDKDITDVEVIARGYSCWLQDKRDTERPEHSTYGAIMLYGASGGHVLMVNTTGIHTVPTMMNVRTNALLQKLLPEEKPEIRIKFSEFDRSPREYGEWLKSFFVILSIVLLTVALAFPPPFFVAFIVEEKACGMKGQLLVSGLRGINYWVANYIFDIVPWTVALSLVTLTFWAYDLEFYFEPEILKIFIATLIGFMAHIVPLAYCLAQLFKDPAPAIISVLIIGFFFVFFYFLWLIFSIDDGGNDGCPNPTEESSCNRIGAEFWTKFLRFHPTFTFSEALIVAQNVNGRFKQTPPDTVSDEQKRLCQIDRDNFKNNRWDCTYSYWEWDACGGPIYTMFAWGFGLMFMVIGLEVLFQTPAATFASQKARDMPPEVGVAEDE